MKRLIYSILFVFSTAGWSFYTPPQASSSYQTGSPAASTAACQITSSRSLTIYERPSLKADVFFQNPPGFTAQAVARTTGGWIGFDPGVAQAANIGPFRLRWVPKKAVTLSGDCSLPRVWAPPPGICFDMPMEDVNVYEHPRTSARVLTVLNLGEFAAVGRRSGTDWVKVDLRKGNTGLKLAGWVGANTLNVNGPCGAVP